MKIKIITCVMMCCITLGVHALDFSFALSSGDLAINAETPVRDSKTWAIGLRQDFSGLPLFLELSARSTVIPFTIYDADGDGEKWDLCIPGVGLRTGWTLKLAETAVSFPFCMSLVAGFPGDGISKDLLSATTGSFSVDFGASFRVSNFEVSLAIVSRLVSADAEGRVSSVMDDPYPGVRAGLSVGL